MEVYNTYKEKQIVVREKLKNLIANFQKNNQDRRFQFAKDFFIAFDELEEEFEFNDRELDKLNSSGAFSSRSYFAEEFSVGLQKSF